jgi:hypothetical protein
MCSYAAKKIYKAKQQFLTLLTYVLCNISIIEYSYRSFNWIIL